MNNFIDNHSLKLYTFTLDWIFWGKGVRTLSKGKSKALKSGLVVLVVCAFMGLSVNASGPEKLNVPSFLDGQRLGLFIGGEKWIVADEPFWVCHGMGYVWKDTSPESKRMLLDNDLTFNVLYIDGNQVDLKAWHHQLDGIMFKMWYVQFNAGAFEAGSTHEFHMVWYDQGLIVMETWSTVHFT